MCNIRPDSTSMLHDWLPCFPLSNHQEAVHGEACTLTILEIIITWFLYYHQNVQFPMLNYHHLECSVIVTLEAFCPLPVIHHCTGYSSTHLLAPWAGSNDPTTWCHKLVHMLANSNSYIPERWGNYIIAVASLGQGVMSYIHLLCLHMQNLLGWNWCVLSC